MMTILNTNQILAIAEDRGVEAEWIHGNLYLVEYVTDDAGDFDWNLIPAPTDNRDLFALLGY